ncbi:sigma-54 dependent transcriptional regulator [Flavitalea sp. BT771]|uniref:sigma-54-dependent transcriptional regulator n=1 Tax=Flavitalea sp. BT771 TaxID=3063329 RepID=UPI0026E40E3B|nr:sigma-54 dependent transcriptional regulator [Flavitalea sp. BT771]MDO6430611.1 sigma-54 dependent transcriptional regulator [Flavitalea sp. BT771]MDV6219249.1 sigma-54 dependent transcriptional regulator [Flavitalea sp. BT771]
MKRILIIDDDMDMCNLLSRFLGKKGFETEAGHSGNKGIAKFKESKFDVVLCDFRLGDKEGREVLKEIKQIDPYAIVIIITGYSDIKTAVDVIKAGAFDYITKPLIPEEVLNVIGRALQQQASGDVSATDSPRPAAAQTAKRKSYTEDEFLVGQAPSTKELYRQIELVAPTNYSIILYGESGTGKEVIARTVHQLSARKDKPFIAMDCGTLSKELAGSELFGHMKGAFTGALADKEGHFELANGGTLFLDEVANLSVEIQAALLRVIQERKFKRVGGVKEMDVDVRIIVASNENLQDSYRKGRFREDLFHRFNEFSIVLPALRYRKEDILPFADFFLAKANKELNKEVEGFDAEVMQIFMNYSWPGNLREFRNVIRRAALLTSGGLINTRVLPPEIVDSNAFGPSASDAYSPTVQHHPVAHKETDLKNAAAQAEYDTIMNVLKQVNYNKSRAAEILKIDRKTLYNKIKSYQP